MKLDEREAEIAVLVLNGYRDMLEIILDVFDEINPGASQESRRRLDKLDATLPRALRPRPQKEVEVKR